MTAVYNPFLLGKSCKQYLDFHEIRNCQQSMFPAYPCAHGDAR
jgi:hypothetical protein